MKLKPIQLSTYLVVKVRGKILNKSLIWVGYEMNQKYCLRKYVFLAFFFLTKINIILIKILYKNKNGFNRI